MHVLKDREDSKFCLGHLRRLHTGRASRLGHAGCTGVHEEERRRKGIPSSSSFLPAKQPRSSACEGKLGWSVDLQGRCTKSTPGLAPPPLPGLTLLGLGEEEEWVVG